MQLTMNTKGLNKAPLMWLPSKAKTIASERTGYSLISSSLLLTDCCLLLIEKYILYGLTHDMAFAAVVKSLSGNLMEKLFTFSARFLLLHVKVRFKTV